ncbi:helix-turn-helix domain-containing protein [Enterocloster aldenensis]|uniref:LexA family protein n=1 Tax=Enterocloster aldenensis TaxID=358742 RepID=UPI000E54E14C|nr:helix-turn-helix domain-containing protein [Enterocloster aldenensis]
MADIGKRIREKRESIGMTQEELAAKLGYKNKSSIAKIEIGANDIVQSKVVEFAKALDTTVAYLMGWDNSPVSNKTDSLKKKTGVIIKVLGSVAAGIPISAVEDIIDEEEVTEDMARQGNLFGLHIKGHSMEPNICDGDTVIVKEQPDAENGETVIVLINGDEATCKKLYKYEDGSIRLVPNNPAFSPRLYTLDEINTLPVTIVGKVIELRRKF